MLTFAIKYKTALNAISGDRELKLWQNELSSEEWEIAVQLRNVLKVCWCVDLYSYSATHNHNHHNSVTQVFKDATLFFLHSTPNLATVIPAMDHIDQLLTTGSINEDYWPAIRASLSIGKTTLNCYYDLTDDLEVYRIAMGMFSYAILAAN